MEAADVIDITREALWVLIKISAPLMIVALVVGFAIGLLQALTQIQEATLTFVPKILAMFLVMIMLMPFFIRQMQDFNAHISERIAEIK